MSMSTEVYESQQEMLMKELRIQALFNNQDQVAKERKARYAELHPKRSLETKEAVDKGHNLERSLSAIEHVLNNPGDYDDATLELVAGRIVGIVGKAGTALVTLGATGKLAADGRR